MIGDRFFFFYLNSRPKKLTDWSFVLVRSHTEISPGVYCWKWKYQICKGTVYIEYVAHCLIIYKAKRTELTLVKMPPKHMKSESNQCQTHQVNQTWEEF